MSNYRDVTLAPDDIEWDRWPDREEVKDALYDDEAYAFFLIKHGLIGALEQITRFHREVANQLIVRAVDEYQRDGWVGRTMRLCRKAKWRRNQLRGLLRAEMGFREAAVAIEEIRLRNPRAEWGSEARNV